MAEDCLSEVLLLVMDHGTVMLRPEMEEPEGLMTQ
jgi:hypothetical protein